RVYALLVKAMENSRLAGLGTYIMRDREQLGCLRVREGALTLEKMFFANEIRPIKEIKPKSSSVPKGELEMAERLIDHFTGKFKAGEVQGHLHRRPQEDRQSKAAGQRGTPLLSSARSRCRI